MQNVVILIPTYNEAPNIEKLLTDLYKRIANLKKYRFSVLVVDDSSPDGTGDLVVRVQKKHRNLHLLSGRKQGLGNAMVRGYQHAMKQLAADVVISNEADFAFDFKHISYMLEKIGEGHDVVIASRHVGVGKTEGWTVTRRLNHWVANTVFASWVAGVDQVYDHNGAFRAVRVRGVLEKIDMRKMPDGFGFFFYSLHALSCVTDRFHEFPVTYRFRQKGESKVSFNPKYFRTYLRDVIEYAKLAFYIRVHGCNILEKAK